MNTYCRWKNAHPRDYKINDAAMLRFVLLLLASPLLVLIAWMYALRDAGKAFLRGRTREAIAYAIFTPFLVAGEAPGYFRARWLSITG